MITNEFGNHYLIQGRQTAAREHLLILNGLRPSKEKSAARDHVNVSAEQNIF